jgi:hypothetical protein
MSTVFNLIKFSNLLMLHRIPREEGRGEGTAVIIGDAGIRETVGSFVRFLALRK